MGLDPNHKFMRINTKPLMFSLMFKLLSTRSGVRLLKTGFLAEYEPLKNSINLYATCHNL